MVGKASRGEAPLSLTQFLNDVDTVIDRYPELLTEPPSSETIHGAVGIVLGFYHVKYPQREPQEIVVEE